MERMSNHPSASQGGLPPFQLNPPFPHSVHPPPSWAGVNGGFLPLLPQNLPAHASSQMQGHTMLHQPMYNSLPFDSSLPCIPPNSIPQNYPTPNQDHVQFSFVPFPSGSQDASPPYSRKRSLFVPDHVEHMEVGGPVVNQPSVDFNLREAVVKAAMNGVKLEVSPSNPGVSSAAPKTLTACLTSTPISHPSPTSLDGPKPGTQSKGWSTWKLNTDTSKVSPCGGDSEKLGTEKMMDAVKKEEKNLADSFVEIQRPHMEMGENCAEKWDKAPLNVMKLMMEKSDAPLSFTSKVKDKRDKSVQTESSVHGEKKKVFDHTPSNRKVIDLQAEVCRLRAQLCLNELQRERFQLELNIFWWRSNFQPVIPCPASRTMSAVQDQLQHLMRQIRQIELQRDQCLRILKSGRELLEVPSFTITFQNGEVITPANAMGGSTLPFAAPCTASTSAPLISCSSPFPSVSCTSVGSSTSASSSVYGSSCKKKKLDVEETPSACTIDHSALLPSQPDRPGLLAGKEGNPVLMPAVSAAASVSKVVILTESRLESGTSSAPVVSMADAKQGTSAGHGCTQAVLSTESALVSSVKLAVSSSVQDSGVISSPGSLVTSAGPAVSSAMTSAEGSILCTESTTPGSNVTVLTNQGSLVQVSTTAVGNTAQTSLPMEGECISSLDPENNNGAFGVEERTVLSEKVENVLSDKTDNSKSNSTAVFEKVRDVQDDKTCNNELNVGAEKQTSVKEIDMFAVESDTDDDQPTSPTRDTTPADLGQLETDDKKCEPGELSEESETCTDAEDEENTHVRLPALHSPCDMQTTASSPADLQVPCPPPTPPTATPPAAGSDRQDAVDILLPLSSPLLDTVAGNTDGSEKKSRSMEMTAEAGKDQAVAEDGGDHGDSTGLVTVGTGEKGDAGDSRDAAVAAVGIEKRGRVDERGGVSTQKATDPDVVMSSVTEKLKELFPEKAKDAEWLKKTSREQTQLILAQLNAVPPLPHSTNMDTFPSVEPPTVYSTISPSTVGAGICQRPSGTDQMRNKAQREEEGYVQEQRGGVAAPRNGSPPLHPYTVESPGDLRQKREVVLAQQKAAMQQQTRLLERSAAMQQTLWALNQQSIANPGDVALSQELQSRLKQYQVLLDEAEMLGQRVLDLEQQQRTIQVTLETLHPNVLFFPGQPAFSPCLPLINSSMSSVQQAEAPVALFQPPIPFILQTQTRSFSFQHPNAPSLAPQPNISVSSMQQPNTPCIPFQPPSSSAMQVNSKTSSLQHPSALLPAPQLSLASAVPHSGPRDSGLQREKPSFLPLPPPLAKPSTRSFRTVFQSSQPVFSRFCKQLTSPVDHHSVSPSHLPVFQPITTRPPFGQSGASTSSSPSLRRSLTPSPPVPATVTPPPTLRIGKPDETSLTKFEVNSGVDKGGAGFDLKTTAGNGNKGGAGFDLKMTAGNGNKGGAGFDLKTTAGNGNKGEAGFDLKMTAGNGNKGGAGFDLKMTAGNGNKGGAGFDLKMTAGNGNKGEAGFDLKMTAGNGNKGGAGFDLKTTAGNGNKGGAGFDLKTTAGNGNKGGAGFKFEGAAGTPCPSSVFSHAFYLSPPTSSAATMTTSSQSKGEVVGKKFVGTSHTLKVSQPSAFKAVESHSVIVSGVQSSCNVSSHIVGHTPIPSFATTGTTTMSSSCRGSLESASPTTSKGHASDAGNIPKSLLSLALTSTTSSLSTFEEAAVPVSEGSLPPGGVLKSTPSSSPTPAAAAPSPEAFMPLLPLKPIKVSSNRYAALAMLGSKCNLPSLTKKKEAVLPKSLTESFLSSGHEKTGSDVHNRGKKKVASDLEDDTEIVSKKRNVEDSSRKTDTGLNDLEDSEEDTWQVSTSKKRGGKGSAKKNWERQRTAASPQAQKPTCVFRRKDKTSPNSSAQQGTAGLTPLHTPPSSLSPQESSSSSAEQPCSSKDKACITFDGMTTADTPCGGKLRAKSAMVPSLLSLDVKPPPGLKVGEARPGKGQQSVTSAPQLSQFSFSKKLAKTASMLGRPRPNIDTGFIDQLVRNNEAANVGEETDSVPRKGWWKVAKSDKYDADHLPEDKPSLEEDWQKSWNFSTCDCDYWKEREGKWGQCAGEC
ncbi:uncharacterized protein LOC143286660 [Babylonia areolata]|uniref:uncharacterized protein LOC143286660 n=1 Tax=Babylonia areolata TaxID=304850 RepID=UPI003FD1CECB